MAGPVVLRFPISGKENEYFLLETSSNGARPLDLKLVGSESTAVFMMKLRHKRVVDYKASSGPCSPKEWEEILTSILVNQHLLPDIEIRADVQSDGTSVSLSFRKNIQGITQRVGSLKLEEDEKTEISPFDWCVSAIGAQEKIQEDLAAANAKTQALEDSLKELKDQLDDLIKTKEEDETQLLEKFRDLLNEKKVKIRQQQRLLASANVDPEKLANIAGNQKVQRRVPQASRSSKRKVKEESESSGDDLEKMDVVEEDDNSGDTQPDVDDDQGGTTADETVSGTDSDDDPPPPPVRSQRKQVAAPKRVTRASTSAMGKPDFTSSEEDDEPPPPKRTLPFMKDKKSTAPPPKPADNDETESDDEF